MKILVVNNSSKWVAGMIKVPLIESSLSSYQIACVVVLHVVHATCSVSPLIYQRYFSSVKFMAWSYFQPMFMKVEIVFRGSAEVFYHNCKFTSGRLHMTEGPFSPDHGRKYIGDSRPWNKVICWLKSTSVMPPLVSIMHWRLHTCFAWTGSCNGISWLRIAWAWLLPDPMAGLKDDGAFLVIWGLSLWANQLVPCWFIHLPVDLQLLDVGSLSKPWTTGTFGLPVPCILLCEPTLEVESLLRWKCGLQENFLLCYHKVWFLGELHLKHDLWADCITSLSNVQKWSRQACRHT